MYSQMEILETKNCILREITLEDANDLFEYYSILNVVKFLPIKVHKTILDTDNFINSFFIKNYKKGKIGHYGILLKGQNKIIGNVGFNNIYPNAKHAEIGICINPKYWGHNLAFELGQALIDYGFLKLNLDYIYAITYNDNVYSKKSLESLNFTHDRDFNKKFKNANNHNQIIKCNKFILYKEHYLYKEDFIK